LITQTNKYRDFVESLEKKIAHFGGSRTMNTAKQRKQASSARCECANLEAARDACLALAEAVENGNLPSNLECFKSMKSIIDATEKRTDSGTGYYSEYYLTDEHRDKGQAAIALRQWLASQADPESEAQRQEREQKRILDGKLSELRSANIEGFFPTPDDVGNSLFRVLDVKGLLVLEPSAGIGSLADIARREGAEVVCIERQSSLVGILKMKGHHVIHDDFLDLEPQPIFDCVVMNPPFEKGAAPRHVFHAFKWLKPEVGIIRAIMPGTCSRYIESKTKALREFAEWVDKWPNAWEELPDGSFKSSFNPTGVSCGILTITNETNPVVYE
jgi:16S rRNA G966 N2-methylase RsmD